MNKLVISNIHGDGEKYIRVGANTKNASSDAASEERATVSSIISCCHLQKKQKPLLTEGPSKSKKRRVRFLQDKEAVIQKDTTSTTKGQGEPLFDILTDDICQRLWFTPTEVTLMRTQIRKLILFGSTGEDEDYAGLERFTDFERSKRKRAAIRFVLLAQMKGCPSDIVQQIASAVSQAAVTEASLQGFHDFCSVYDPLEGLLGSPTTPIIDDGSCDQQQTTRNTTVTSYNETFFGEVPVTTTTTTRKRKLMLPLIQPQPQKQQLQEVLSLPKSSNKLCGIKKKRIPTKSMVLPAINTGSIGCLDDDDSNSNSHSCDPLLGKRRRIQLTTTTTTTTK